MCPKRSLSKIRSETSENPSGWKAKEIMNIIHRKTGVMYHEVHIYRLLHKWGFSPKVPERGLLTCIQMKKRSSSKKTQEIISNTPDDFTVAVEDESIFVMMR